LVVGYSYGEFTAKDLFKVGGILTLVEGLIVMVLVPLYWPLIGFADDMSQARPETSYLKDEILLPVVRKFAPRSQVLVMLHPDARTLREGGNHVVQVAQERWPELPIHAVVLDHTKPPTPARQARPPQNRPGRRVLVLEDTPG
jgi:hypothetical protein